MQQRENIHPTAIVHPSAVVHETTSVGPYAVVGEHVRVGAHCEIGSHCVLSGRTVLGEANIIHPHAVIGGVPQDKKYAGEETQLLIGNGNTFHEFATVNIGTVQGGGVTRIADDNWIMAYVHIAHDCQVGSHTIMANSVALAGHVSVGDWVVLGGLSGVHQFSRIGAHAMIGFCSHVSQDVAPFVLAGGNPLQVYGLNAEGLRRRQFNEAQLAALKVAYRTVFRSDLALQEACKQLRIQIEQLAAGQGQEQVRSLLDFLESSQRGIAR